MFELMTDHRQLADLFEHASAGFAVTDGKGIVVDINKAFARIVARTPVKIRGANLFDWTHPEDAARHRALLQQLLSAQIPGFVIEKRYIRPDGTSVWVRNSVSVINETDDQPHVISICEDISDRKRAERALEDQDRLASIGKLTSSIIHEINNPLEAVVNLVYLARQSIPVGAASAYLKQAEHELGRASEITAGGLQFHRQSASPAPANLAELLKSVLILFKSRFREARVETQFEMQNAEIICFAGEIRQVFVNLIGNAVESMPSGGFVKMRVRAATVWSTGERGVRVTIADTGEGMTNETRNRLYDAFFTTKGSEGSGLGLWVTRNIVRKHRGSIQVRSRCSARDGGTVFSVVFPYRGAGDRAPGSQAA